jgi:hypothetical protein
MDIANNRKLKTINQTRKQSLQLLLPISCFLKTDTYLKLATCTLATKKLDKPPQKMQ